MKSSQLSACRQSDVSAYCCSAVSRSSIARPPPFLGVSSLNLAAPRSGHFFARPFWVLAASPLRSWTLSPLRLRLLASPQNCSRKRVSLFPAILLRPQNPSRRILVALKRIYSAASGRLSGRPRLERGMAVRLRMARVRRVRTDSNAIFLAMRSSSR